MKDEILILNIFFYKIKCPPGSNICLIVTTIQLGSWMVDLNDKCNGDGLAGYNGFTLKLFNIAWYCLVPVWGNDLCVWAWSGPQSADAVIQKTSLWWSAFLFLQSHAPLLEYGLRGHGDKYWLKSSCLKTMKRVFKAMVEPSGWFCLICTWLVKRF